MILENYIPISNLCLHYQVELSFFEQINESDLIDIETYDQVQYIAAEKINDVEKMIRLYHELKVSVEHLDIVFNLVNKIEALQSQLKSAQSRLKFYQEIDLI